MERLHATRCDDCHHTSTHPGDGILQARAHAPIYRLRMIYWRRAERTPVAFTLLILLTTLPAASGYIERDYPDGAANLFALLTHT